MAPTRRRKTAAALPRAKPHARKKTAAAERASAPIDLDEEWLARAQAIRRDLLEDCHPWQRDAVLDPSKYISLLVGRGGGKTTVMAVRALLILISESQQTVAYVATSRPEARRLNWRPMQALVRGIGAWDDFEWHEGRMECTCKRTGSIYTFFGADDQREVNKLRGQPFRELQIDEAASHDIDLLAYLIDEAVDPRMGENDGTILLGGTPGRVLVGLFYDVTREGNDEEIKHRPFRDREKPEWAGWTGWSSHKWNMLDVLKLEGVGREKHQKYWRLVRNWERALRKKKNERWPDTHPIWKREYEGIWVANNTTMIYGAYRARLTGDEAIAAGVADGSLWNRWEPLGGLKLEGLEMLKAALAALPRDLGDEWLFGYGSDLGSKDPFALNIAALCPTDPHRRIFHVFCFERRRMYARTIAELLIGAEAVEKVLRGEPWDELGGLIGLTGWPVAFVADDSGKGQAILDELQNVYGIRVAPAVRKNKRGAIDNVNGDFEIGRAFILGDSLLESQITRLQWKLDEHGIPQENKGDANHSADAWTYIRTEVGALFTGPSAPPRSFAPPVAKAAAAGKKKPATPGGRWERRRGGPRSRTGGGGDRGEFGALLSRDNFHNPDQWGND